MYICNILLNVSALKFFNFYRQLKYYLKKKKFNLKRNKKITFYVTKNF